MPEGILLIKQADHISSTALNSQQDPQTLESTVITIKPQKDQTSIYIHLSKDLHKRSQVQFGGSFILFPAPHVD